MGSFFEWDEEKSRQCLEERGFDFSIVEVFDFAEATIREDDRRDCGERRFLAIGLIGGKALVTAFTPRPPKLRIISVRRANPKERKRYGKEDKA